jgi:hypothetical protein
MLPNAFLDCHKQRREAFGLVSLSSNSTLACVVMCLTRGFWPIHLFMQQRLSDLDLYKAHKRVS